MPNKNDKKQNQDNKDPFAKLDFESKPFKFNEYWLQQLKERFWDAKGSTVGVPRLFENADDTFSLANPFGLFIADVEPCIGAALLQLKHFRKPLKSKEKDVVEKLKATSIELIRQLNELHPSIALKLESAYFYGYSRKPLISEVKRLVQVLDKILPSVINKRGRPGSEWIFLVAAIAGIMYSHGLNPTLRAGFLSYILEAVMDTIGLPDQPIETMMEQAWPIIKQDIEYETSGFDPEQ